MVVWHSYQKRASRLAWLGAVLYVVAVWVLQPLAVAAIARGYSTDDSGLQVGMIASLSKEGSNKIERATQENVARVVGVVTTYEKSSVTLASDKSKMLIENDGDVDAYVTDMAGQVKQGDLLVLSPLKGILMKGSETSSAKVIGIAAASMDGSAESSPYSGQDDSLKRDTKIYKLKVTINRQGGAANTQSKDSVLANIGEKLTGRQVGEIRVLVALILFLVVLIAEGAIIYGAISSAVISLGRNPLAKGVINKEMIQVVGIALLVLLVGLGSVYAVLWA